MERVDMERYDLPEGWTWKKLPEVAEIVMGQSPPSSTYNEEGIGLPFYQGKADFGELYPKPRKWCSVPGKVAKPGDILMSVRAPVGPTNLADTECCIGRGLCAIRPSGDMPSRFLLEYFRWIERYIADMGQGSTFTAISRRDIETVDVPLPTLAEQERIVVRIEALFRQSRAAREALERIPPLFRRFRQAVLAAAFRGDLVPQDSADEPAVAILKRIQAQRKALPLLDTSALLDLPKEWAWTTIGEVAETTSGGTPLRNHPEYYHGTIPWIKSGELEDNIISDAEEFITGEGLKNSSAKVFPKGTALVALYGATVGKTGILGIDAATNQAVCAVFPLNEAFTAEFITYWLQYQRQKLIDQSAGGAQPNISQRILRAFPMPLVPLAEQRRIVARIQEFFARAEAVEAAVAIARRRLDKLDQAILARAFRGELVPQSQ
ncbi:MAG: hypothetical protein FJ014_18830 [Chloroflexi bacterium]|nr:hypothetical protein [Chloroflexota bacterium]